MSSVFLAFLFNWDVVVKVKSVYTAQPKKLKPEIFNWTAFSFDDSTHLQWHRFKKLMQFHNMYSRPEWHSFFNKTDVGGIRTSSPAHS